MAVTLLQVSKNMKDDNKLDIQWLEKTDASAVALVHEGKYRVEIQNLKPELGWDPGVPVKVYCSCPDMQFRYAYVLWKHGGLLHEENFVLEPPKVRNPGMVVQACKHVGKVARELMSEAQKV